MQPAKWTYINTKEQGHLPSDGPSDSVVLKIFSKTTGLTETKLHKESQWDLGHMPKMVVMPIYGKRI